MALTPDQRATNSQSLLDLRNSLAANYFNVSLARINPDKLVEGSPERQQYEDMLGRVFSSKPPNMGFTRNILIVGAGASQQAFSFFKDGSGTIQEVEEALDLPSRLKSDHHFREVYELKAQERLRAVVKPGTETKLLQRKLGFEGRLTLLEELYTPQEVRRALNDIVHYRYFPNQAYEIMAHMFKHRFIDVVVNLNFDELLDNAISDEIGDGTMNLLTPNSVAVNGDALFTHNRLRNPIYIKPHGTSSQLTSMSYTDAHYLRMNESMKQVLLKVFQGATGNNSKEHTPVINIMLVGYAFQDIDIQGVLFEAIRLNATGTFNLFLWSRDPQERFKQLGSAYAEYMTSVNWLPSLSKKQIKGERDSWTTKWNSGSKVKLKAIHYDESLENQYDSDFLNLYKDLNGAFEKPFTVGNPTRHELLAKLFNRKYVENLHGALQGLRPRLDPNDEEEDRSRKSRPLRERLQTFYKHRLLYHVLYDYFKHNGRIPFSVLQGERAATYYELYLENHLGEERFSALSLDELAKEKEQDADPEMLPDFVYDEFHCGKVLDESKKADLAQAASTVLVEKMAATAGYENKDMVIDSLATSLCELGKHRHLEITPKLFDPKYSRFKAYDAAQVVFTNLHLTYLFYSMFKDDDKRGEWNRLMYSSDSARAIYNLFQYATPDTTDLLSFVNTPDKRFEILARDTSPVGGKTVLYKGGVLNNLAGHLGNTQCTMAQPTDLSPNLHHMALFLRDDKPRFGIYFFKPPSRNRINPVYFDITGKWMTEIVRNVANDPARKQPIDDSTEQNLLTMKSLFEREFARGDKFTPVVQRV